MNGWDVFTVISALVVFIIAVVKPLLKLNTSITELNVTIKNLNGTVATNQTKLEQHELESRRTLENHEKRITKLEIKGGEK